MTIWKKTERHKFAFLWLLTVVGAVMVCGVVYLLVVLPVQMDQACASHTHSFCMAVMDPEGIGYAKATPVLAIFASTAILLPVAYLWYEHFTSISKVSLGGR